MVASTGDVTSGLERPLAVEIDITRNSTTKKHKYNFEAVLVRQEMCIEY
jgi:hypothetical protein